jgi:hypothetical protein
MAFPLFALLAALGKGLGGGTAAAGKAIGTAAAGAGKAAAAGAGALTKAGGLAASGVGKAAGTALSGIADLASQAVGAGGNVLSKAGTQAGKAVEGGSKALSKITGATESGAGAKQNPISMLTGGGRGGSKESDDPLAGTAPAPPTKRGGALAGIGRGVAGLGKGVQGAMEWYRDTPTPLDIVPPMARMKGVFQDTQAASMGKDFAALKEFQPGSKPWFDQFGQMAKQYGMNGIKQFMAQPQGQKEQQFQGPTSPEDQARIAYYNRMGQSRPGPEIAQGNLDLKRGTALLDRFDQGTPEYQQGMGLIRGQQPAVPKRVETFNQNTGAQSINGAPTGLVNPEALQSSGPLRAPQGLPSGPGSALSAIPVARANPKIPWLREDAPPGLAAKVQQALDAGLSVDEIMQAADIQPYLMR